LLSLNQQLPVGFSWLSSADINLSDSRNGLADHSTLLEAAIMTPTPVRRQTLSDNRQPADCNLVKNYHRVGPAAINAALACRPRKQEQERRPLYEPREES
jgi:hypothetical protein